MTVMRLLEPVWWSWPCVRHLEQECEGADSEVNTELTSQQLAAWVKALLVEDYQLVITADSLRLLPQQLAYDLIGPMVLAAVDSRSTLQQHHGCRINPQQSSAQQVQANTLLKPAQQQLQGLQLVSIDLQEPIAQPLRCCLEAYTHIQQLHLKDLNIDVPMAKTLGSILHHSNQEVSRQSRRCRLQSLGFDGVFMCDSAWQAFAEGLAAGCGLQSLRFSNCLTASSLGLLATAMASGCSQLQRLELSHSLWENPSSMYVDTDADTAWVQLFQGLTQGCKHLQCLCLMHCTLGITAAAQLSKLLHTLPLQQLTLQHCCGLGQGLPQVIAAAASCSALQRLDLSNTGCTDDGLKALTATNWIAGLSAMGSRTRALGLTELLVGGNRLSGAFVSQVLAKQLTSGLLSNVTVLNLAGCSSVGDEGALALASVLASGRLECLDVSGCEITDYGAEALAASLVPTSAASVKAGLRGQSTKASHQPASSLLRIKLSDNQFTAVGIQQFATAISKPDCRLVLLDVSFNWVGPRAMQPLVTAAAERNASTADSNNHITVLHECLPEYWRVEAAKAAAAGSLQEPAVAEVLDLESSISLCDSSSYCEHHSCSSSAGSSQHHSARDVGEDALCQAVQGDDSIDQQHNTGMAGTVWTFNSLFCNEGLQVSRASSAIAADVDAGDDMCRICTESDCRSDSSSMDIPAYVIESSVSHMLMQTAGSSVTTTLPVEPVLPPCALNASKYETSAGSSNQSVQLQQSLAAGVARAGPAAEASAADSTQSVDVGDNGLNDVGRTTCRFDAAGLRLQHLHGLAANPTQSDEISGLRDQQVATGSSSQESSTSCQGQSSKAASTMPRSMVAGTKVMGHWRAQASDSCGKQGSQAQPEGSITSGLAMSSGIRSTTVGTSAAITAGSSISTHGAPLSSTPPTPGLKTLRSMRCRVAAGQPGQCLSPAQRPRPPGTPCSNPHSVQSPILQSATTSGDGWCVVGAQHQVKAVAQASLVCRQFAEATDAVLSVDHAAVIAEQDELAVKECLVRATAARTAAALPSVTS